MFTFLLLKEREMNMLNEREKLYNKMQEEMDNFIHDLEGKSINEIMDKSYEHTIKYEILSMFYPDFKFLDSNDIKVLLRLEKPLNSLYNDWLDSDYNTSDIIVDSVADSLERLRQCQKKEFER